MHKLLACLFFLIMVLGSVAHVQTSRYGGIRESTDPQRAEEIENKARQISGQSASETGATSTAPDTPTETKKLLEKRKKCTQNRIKNHVNRRVPEHRQAQRHQAPQKRKLRKPNPQNKLADSCGHHSSAKMFR